MIEHSNFWLKPEIFSIGPLSFKWYGFVYAMGFLAIYYFFRYLVKKGVFEELDYDKIDSLIMYVMIGIIVGGRLGIILFYEPSYYFSNPMEMLKIWKGGMAFHGALIGIIISMTMYCRKYKINFYKIADVMVIPTAFALGFGRIANYINGELIGTVTKSNICIHYQGVEGCRVPSQFMESLKNFSIALFLAPKYYMYKLKNETKFKLFGKELFDIKDGFFFLMFIILYSILRFLITFFREDIRYYGLSLGQYYCLIGLIVGSYFMYKLYSD